MRVEAARAALRGRGVRVGGDGFSGDLVEGGRPKFTGT